MAMCHLAERMAWAEKKSEKTAKVKEKTRNTFISLFCYSSIGDAVHFQHPKYKHLTDWIEEVVRKGSHTLTCCQTCTRWEWSAGSPTRRQWSSKRRVTSRAVPSYLYRPDNFTCVSPVTVCTHTLSLKRVGLWCLSSSSPLLTQCSVTTCDGCGTFMNLKIWHIMSLLFIHQQAPQVCSTSQPS